MKMSMTPITKKSNSTREGMSGCAARSLPGRHRRARDRDQVGHDGRCSARTPTLRRSSTVMVEAQHRQTLRILSYCVLAKPNLAILPISDLSRFSDKGWVPLIRLESLHFPFMTTLAVLIAWSALLGTRVCLAEKSWIDRLGRLVGVAWIISGLYSQIEQYYLW